MRRSSSTTCSSGSPASWTASSSAASGCARTSSEASGCTPAARVLDRADGRRRPLARGRLRDRPARRAPGGRRAPAPARAPGPRSRRHAPAARPRPSTPASTTRRSSVTSPAIIARLDGLEARSRVAGWLATFRSGKVRDLYRSATGRLLLVASDRLSAFDVVLPTEIPDKGRVLTGLSRFWFAETGRIVPNHLIATDRWPCPASSATRSSSRPTRPATTTGRRPRSCAAG